ERDKALDEVAELKATVEELAQARSDAEAREAAAQTELKRERSKAVYKAAALKVTVPAAFFVRRSVMQFGSIAAAVAFGFWTYHFIWSAPQPLSPGMSEPAAVENAASANTTPVKQPAPTDTSKPGPAQETALQAPAQQAAPQASAQEPAPQASSTKPSL